MAENFWDVLEGRTSSEAPRAQAAPSQAAPSQAAPSQPEPASPPAKKRPARDAGVSIPPPEQLFDAATFQPSAERVAGRVASTASAMKQQMPEATAASPTKDFMDNILSLWQIPATIFAYEVGRRSYKAFKEAGAPAKTSSILDTDIQFNRPAETDAMPKPSAPAPAPAPTQTVMTAGGPVNLSEVPKEMRPMVERSAQVTQQKMTAAPVAPSATPAIAPSATPAIAPSATPVVQGAVAPGEQAMLNWVRGQMKQRGFADLSDDAVRGFLKTFYGDAPIVPGAGAAPEGYGTRFAEWAKQNIAGPGVGLPREEMKAIKARAAVAPPQETKPTKGPESQKGSASMGGMANTALNAAGGLLLLDMFKKARETGDYSDFALGAIGQVLGNIAPRVANVGYMLMQPSTLADGTLNSPEYQELMRRRNAGAGRGFVNPPQFR